MASAIVITSETMLIKKSFPAKGSLKKKRPPLKIKAKIVSKRKISKRALKCFIRVMA
jgi:hypothetical protein